MSTVHNVLNGLLYLPDTEPLRRKAEMAVQLFKDFNFHVSGGSSSGSITPTPTPDPEPTPDSTPDPTPDPDPSGGGSGGSGGGGGNE